MPTFLRPAAIIVFAGAVLLAPALTHAQSSGAPTSSRPTIERPTSTSSGLGTSTLPGANAERRASIQAEIEARIQQVRQNAADAQTAINEARETASDIIAERRAEVSVRVSDIRTAARERFGDVVESAVGSIVERLTAAVDRLEWTADRLEGYIGDSTEAADLLEEARVDIATASDSVVSVSAALQEAVGSEAPREHVPAIRSAIQAAQQALIAARSALRDVLTAIRTERSALPAPTTDTFPAADTN